MVYCSEMMNSRPYRDDFRTGWSRQERKCDDRFCGIRIGDQHQTEVEWRDDRFEKSVDPDLGVYEDWPALPLPRAPTLKVDASSDRHVLF